MIDEPAVLVEGVVKSFGPVLAVDHVDWSLEPGEVHALLGENGAGKSTLCSILAGVFRPDAGRVVVAGEEQEFASPRDALVAGIGMVFQEFQLLKRMSVAENLALAAPTSRVILRRRSIERAAEAAAEAFGLDIDPSAIVSELTMGEQQRVEILRLLMRNTSVLVLDEPTSVLTPQESEALFDTMRSLAEKGKAVVFVSHKLDEVCAAADRITVLRDGRVVAQVPRGEIEPPELARLMVGRDIEVPRRAKRGEGQRAVLTVSGVSAHDDRGQIAVRDVSFELYEGEVLGIAGVAGNGQRELAEVIAGLRQSHEGTITWGADGRDLSNLSVRARWDLGIAYVPDDRIGTAIAADLPGWISLALRNFERPEYSAGPFLRIRKLREDAERQAREFGVRGEISNGEVRHLSGGNIQRLVLARELAQQPKVLIAASPTRGLDVGAVVGVHKLLFEQCAAGTGVLVSSEDLDELFSICHRIIVMFEGRVVGECVPGQIDIATIGIMMSGHEAAPAPAPAPGDAEDRAEGASVP